MGRTVLSGVAILFVAAGASYLAAVRADSPEQLVAELQKAASDGDVEGYLSTLTSESRKVVESSDANRVSLREAQAEFQKALDEKFGAGTAWVPDTTERGDLRGAISEIVAAEMVSKKEGEDGSVELKIRTTVKTGDDTTATVENTVAARKEDDEWKLSLGFAKERLDTERIKGEVARIAGEVRAGKYEDRIAAMIALDNSIRRMEGK
ncbi:MAG TPA: hypothetical protein VNA22_07770 [Pyrinomonadaceae bacterium]|nr:hypothetical protein [Pyrinomonadaceae bacterium]